MYNLMHWFVQQLVLMETFLLVYSDKDNLRDEMHHDEFTSSKQKLMHNIV